MRGCGCYTLSASLAPDLMLRRLYDWMMGLAGHRHAVWWLGFISFVESSFFPIPPDAMLVPMVLAERRRAWLYATVCTLTSVAGGFLGYAIGLYAMESIGFAILSALHLIEKFHALKPVIDEWGVWFIVIKGATPIPYKLVTITAGAFEFDLMKFAIASVATRGLRFFLVAALLWRFGPPIRDFIERRLTLVTTSFVVALVGGFFAVKLI